MYNLAMPPVDKSILSSKQNQGDSYLDDLAFAICVNGESLEKYKKIVEKQFGNEAYANMEQFAHVLQQQVERGQFTNTSLLNLKYLGKNAGISEEAIDLIVNHFSSKVDEERQLFEENEYWNNCDHNDKHALLEYARKYPKGRYVKEAHAKINAINKEENAKREENIFWNQCNPNDKRQLNEYLKKYPKGVYVARAKSLIADLERIEKEAIEESRMFNQCHTQRDYINFLGSYPNGAYAVKAKLRIEEFERQGRKEMEESRVYKLCKTKKDYQEYLRKYPKGKFAYDAQSKIWDLERKEEEHSRREENSFWSQCNDTNKESLQRYLSKYPNGTYASRAKSLIADIERKEREAVEESRMYYQCRSKADYIEFLRKYPNGQYINKAKEKVKEYGSESREEREMKISELDTYKQCKTKDDFLRYLRLYPDGMYVYPAHKEIAHLEKIKGVKEGVKKEKEYPNGQYINKAKEKVKEYGSESREEREMKISELDTYKQCKTKDDFLRYLRLYPDGMYVYPAHKEIAHLEKIKGVKEGVKKEKEKEKEKEKIKTTDVVPDEVRDKLVNLNKIAGRSYILAALTFAFLPNVFRWNHWAYLEMEACGNAPTLWLFWLPIVASLWGYWFHWLDSDTYMSKGRIVSAMKNDKIDRISTLIPCLLLLAWMFIKGLNISAFLDVYMEELHMFFMGPIICGIAWCAGLYCEYKMSRVAKNLYPGND